MRDEHGGNPRGADVLYDFSANLNPLGMPESVRAALISSVGDWERYPDPFCVKLTGKLAGTYGVSSEKIVCGNGAADLIYRIVREVKPKKSVICAPCFSEYEKALREVGSAVETFRLSAENGFPVTEGILETLCGGADMLILCSPNNPTGRIIPREVLRKICELCHEKGIVFLCDECFLELCEDPAESSALRFLNDKLIVLNAFTKSYAMAGLRLGFAVFGDEELARRVRENGQYWSVSAPAQTAGLAALEEKNYLERSRELISFEREFLKSSLEQLDIKVFESDANFLLLKSEKPLYDELLKRRIMIRSCANFAGLDESFFRIAVRTHKENLALVRTLSEFC